MPSLTIQALRYLRDVARNSEKVPIAQTFQLRVALAYLYLNSGSPNRVPFDGFWKAATSRDDRPTEHMAGYMRFRDSSGCLTAICRAYGLDDVP